MLGISLDNLIGIACMIYLQNTNSRILSINKIIQYSKSIADFLSNQKIQVYFLFTEERLNNFLIRNSDFFYRSSSNLYIIVKDEITIEDLNEKYCNFESNDIRSAFFYEGNIKELF